MSNRPLTATSVPGIYRRGNGYVVVQRDQNGRQFKHAASTMALARQIQATIRADIVRGELPSEFRRTTFAEYVQEWLETYTGRTNRGVRAMTMDNYRRALEKGAVPFFKGRYLSDIEPRDIKRFGAHVASRGVSNNTVRLVLAPVRALFATAFEDGLIRANPASGIRNTWGRRTQDERKVKSLSESELSRLIDEIPERHRLLIEFMSQTGLRIGEALGMQWWDLDLDAGLLHVRRRLYEGTLDAPKSHYGTRTIPLTAEMRGKLGELHRTRLGVDREAHVFCSDAGTPFDKHNLLSRVLKPAAVRAGVPWANLHTLRHTCASRLFDNGWNAKQVQTMLGHHSPAFTLETYVHVRPEELPSPEFLTNAGAVIAPVPHEPAAEAAERPRLRLVQ